MFTLTGLYRENLALLTDLYQLTMAQGYWKVGKAEEKAAFHLFFRKTPFQSGYAVTAGLGYLLDLPERLRFGADDLAFLGKLPGNDGKTMFDPRFLAYLADLKFTCDVDAIPEGTPAFGMEPLVRMTGPMLQCQLLETLLLNVVNFQTLIATKAARVCLAAGDDSVLEFGLRRAQGIDGALAASRAAYLGGCAATSNVLAGKLFGIPVKGTHAHSWVMSFDNETHAFEAYADAMPNNCVFLVDTYDTVDGVRHAIHAGRKLREKGHKMIGIRLDSGDLAYLSIEARKMLDAAGFPDAVIVGSNDLDEHLITALKQQGAPIGVWGVGTKLVTAYDQPALGGVYKLGAMFDEGTGKWTPRIKVSEQVVKTTTPGVLQVRRYEDEHGLIGDMIYDEGVVGPPADGKETGLVDPKDPTRIKRISAGAGYTELLTPIYRGGKLIYDPPKLSEIREETKRNLAQFHPGIKRLVNPHEYPVGLEPGLNKLKIELITRTRREARDRTIALATAEEPQI